MDSVIKEKIESVLAESPVVLFIKGTPDFPQCGFSARTMSLIAETNLPFAFVNILESPQLRQALPEYSDWPTFPQVFFNSELVGGGDIIAQMAEEGTLAQSMQGAIDSFEGRSTKTL